MGKSGKRPDLHRVLFKEKIESGKTQNPDGDLGSQLLSEKLESQRNDMGMAPSVVISTGIIVIVALVPRMRNFTGLVNCC